MQIDEGAFLDDAITQMEKTWLDRKHWTYSVELRTGRTTQEILEPILRFGVALFRTTDDENGPWLAQIELPSGSKSKQCRDIDEVWQYIKEERKNY